VVYRYVVPAEHLWDYLEAYLDDSEEFIPGTDKSIKLYVVLSSQNSCLHKLGGDPHRPNSCCFDSV
jgi:hypothetical protein